jgi:hypothetical protein
MSILRRIAPDKSITESTGLTAANLAGIQITALLSAYYAVSASVYASGASGFLASGIYGAGDIADVNIRAFNEAEVYAYMTASGDVGDVQIQGAGSSDVNVYISAGQGTAADGDIGDITLRAIGHESSAYVRLTSDGDIGDIRAIAANPEGEAEVDAYAYSGNIASFEMILRGGEASGSAAISAFGGNIGDFRWISYAASGSGYVSAKASAVAVGGVAKGGDIGDITIFSRGMSGDYDVYISAYGEGQAGRYLGGGNIGDISIHNIQIQGGSGELEFRADAYSGGDIGDIKVRQLLTDAHSSSANVYVSAHGFAGEIVSIGDIDYEVLSRRGTDNSAYVDVQAGTDGTRAGNIGDINVVFNELGGGSSELDVYASAFADANGSGGNIGDIRLINTGYRGNSDIDIKAAGRVGNIYVAMGPGSSNADLELYGTADVGDITFAIHPMNSSTTHYLDLFMSSTKSEIGLVRVTGGSFLSDFELTQDTALSIAGVDLSQFAGSGDVNIDSIKIGTVIKASRAGSTIKGTEGQDTIHLGDGRDTVIVPTRPSDGDADKIYAFDGSSTAFDKIQFAFNVSTFQTDTDKTDGPASPSPSTSPPSPLIDGDLLRLIDPSAASLMGAELLAKLNSGGTFAHFNAPTGGAGEALAAVAASSTETTWKLFELKWDGSDIEFDSVRLLAIVNSNVTLADMPRTVGVL